MSWQEEAQAMVTGVDDAGGSPGETVVLTVPAGGSCTVDAAQLDSGSGLACGSAQAGLGDGSGKWRLRLEANGDIAAMSLLSSRTGHLTNLSRSDASRGFERAPAALLPPPATVTLTSPAPRELRGRWSAVEGARYAVDLLRDGVREGGPVADPLDGHDVPLGEPAPGRYAIRACSVNEDRECGDWSAPSDEVVID